MVDPRAVPRVDIDRFVSERRTGGLGMHLMEKIMDSVTFRRADGGERVPAGQAQGSEPRRPSRSPAALPTDQRASLLRAVGDRVAGAESGRGRDSTPGSPS